MTRKVDGGIEFDPQNSRNPEHTSKPFDVTGKASNGNNIPLLLPPARVKDDFGNLSRDPILLAEDKKTEHPSNADRNRVHLTDKEIIQLEVRFKVEHDPVKKLALWKEYQTAVVENGADSIQLNKSKPDFKNKLETNSKQEIEEECTQIQKQIDSGSPDAAKSIAELYERKKIEFQLEQKYQVTLTNDTDYTPTNDPNREPSKRVVWSKKELETLDETLMRLPNQDVKNNPKLQEIKRCVKSQDWDPTKKAWAPEKEVGGDHLGDRIRIYDHGVNKGLRDSLTHEVGHAVYDRLSDSPQGRKLINQYENAVEWEEFANKDTVKKSMRETIRRQLQDEGLDEKEINRVLDNKTNEKFTSLEKNSGLEGTLVDPKISIGDKRYKHDPYGSPKYYAYNKAIMPRIGAFDYASATPGEYFAEHYKMEHNMPEIAGIYMNKEPQKELIEAQNEMASAMTDADKKSAQNKLNTARKKFDALSLQRKIMREQVMHPERLENASHEQAIKEVFPHYSA